MAIAEEIKILRERSHEYGNALSKHDARLDRVFTEIASLDAKLCEEVSILVARLGSSEKATNGKVSFSTFTWVFGLMFSILAIILGVIWTEVKEIRTETKDTGNKVATIEGLLQNASITNTPNGSQH